MFVRLTTMACVLELYKNNNSSLYCVYSTNILNVGNTILVFKV